MYRKLILFLVLIETLAFSLKADDRIVENGVRISKSVEEKKKYYKKYHKDGMNYYRARNYTEAIKCFKNVVILKPFLASAHYNLGLVYYENGDKKKALKEFKKVLKLKPDHVKARKKIEKIMKEGGYGVLPKIIKIPVIFYDFKSDESNPNFQFNRTRKKGKVHSIRVISRTISQLKIIDNKGNIHTYKITKNTKVYGLGGVIPEGVSKINPINIPPDQDIKFQVNPKNPYTIVTIEDPSDEYLRYIRKALKNGKNRKKDKSTEGMIFNHLNKDRKPVLRLYRQHQGNYRLNEWYYPSGIKGTDAEFKYDILKDKWKWTGLKPYKDRPNEFIGKNFNETDPMANVVIYDFLEFKLKATTTKANKNKKGVYIFNSQRFYPIDKKGFRETKMDKKEGIHNYSFAMELHTKFLYTGGEYFKFSSDNDMWLFIDGKLQLDLGGRVNAREGRVELDKISGLKKGRIYSFDLFLAERERTVGSSLMIEGTIKLKEPEPIVMGIMADRDTFIPGEEQVKISVIGLPVEHQAWLLGIWGTGRDAIRLFKGTGEMKKLIEWDGKDEKGNLVQGDKEYRLLARGIDPEGKEWESNLIALKSEMKLKRGSMKLKRGSKIVIGAINFEPFPYTLTLTSRSKIGLERVCKILKEYPIARFLIKGHVDSFAGWSKEKLLELSQKRAEAIKQYLVDRGIAPGRLEAKGYGDTDPISDEDTDEARKLNGRTEIKALPPK